MNPTKLRVIFEEMWNMQAELNKMVGRDTLALGTSKCVDRETIRSMSEDYMDEVMNELTEAKENFYHKWWVKEVIENPKLRFTPIDLAKIKVELIDVLHFLISACQLNDVRFYHQETLAKYLYAYAKCDDRMTHRDAYYCLNSAMRGAMDGDVHLIFRSLFCIFKFYKISFEEMLEVYKMKLEKNRIRYNTGYSVKTKTEQDNHEIEEKIRNAQT